LRVSYPGYLPIASLEVEPACAQKLFISPKYGRIIRKITCFSNSNSTELRGGTLMASADKSKLELRHTSMIRAKFTHIAFFPVASPLD
jgi:hypothetical protein